MKIALVHDFLTQRGGAERVLEELHTLFPHAPVYTLVYDEKKTKEHYQGWDIRTSFLQRLPGGVRHYKWYLGLMPFAIESFDFSGYDIVLSDASAFAKGIKVKPPTKHICYCHTPTRYLWQDRQQYVSTIPYPWFIKLGVKPILWWLRDWDRRAAERIDCLIANSKEVAGRIEKYYHRKPDAIIYPPVDTTFFAPSFPPPPRRGSLGEGERESQSPSPNPSLEGRGETGDYFFIAGRLEPYKRFDLAIEACKRLELPLKVAGSGSLVQELKKHAGPTVEFLGRVSDEELHNLYRGAKAFIFPALEDAGMTIVESLAAGTPVIAFQGGGALEFIQPGINGEFFTLQSVDSLIKSLQAFDASRYDQKIIVETAEPFDKEVFRKKILELVSAVSSSK